MREEDEGEMIENEGNRNVPAKGLVTISRLP